MEPMQGHDGREGKADAAWLQRQVDELREQQSVLLERLDRQQRDAGATLRTAVAQALESALGSSVKPYPVQLRSPRDATSSVPPPLQWPPVPKSPTPRSEIPDPPFRN